MVSEVDHHDGLHRVDRGEPAQGPRDNRHGHPGQVWQRPGRRVLRGLRPGVLEGCPRQVGPLQERQGRRGK